MRAGLEARAPASGCLATAFGLWLAAVGSGSFYDPREAAMNGERRVSLVNRDTEPSKKDLQVRVYPSELRFMDAEVGKVYRLSLILHNVGRVNQKIRFQQPSKRQVTRTRPPRGGKEEELISDFPIDLFWIWKVWKGARGG